MIGKQTEKHFVFTVADQLDRQAPAGRVKPKRSGLQGFAASKLLPRLITVCAWCKGTQNADGFWRRAENDPQTDAETAVSHGICPECAEKSYNEYRLATFAASAHLASARAA